jgi:hypothetical protein
MNRYLMVCRLRWPSLLILTGIIALLSRMDIMSWGHAWPLYLILLGVLSLAERAALAAEPVPPAGYPPYGYDPAGYAAPGAPYAPQPSAPQSQPAQPASTGIVPSNSELGLSANDSRRSWDQEER